MFSVNAKRHFEMFYGFRSIDKQKKILSSFEHLFSYTNIREDLNLKKTV